MVVHVDQVKVDEPAPCPTGPHGDMQILYPVRRQHEHTLGVRLEEQKRSGSGHSPEHLQPRAQRESQLFWGEGGPRGLHEARRGPSDNVRPETRPSHAVRVTAHHGRHRYPCGQTPLPPPWHRPLSTRAASAEGELSELPARNPGKGSALPSLSRRTVVVKLIPELLLIFAFQ